MPEQDIPRVPKEVNPLGPEHREKLKRAKQALANARPLLEALEFCQIGCDDQRASHEGLCLMCDRVEQVFFPNNVQSALEP